MGWMETCAVDERMRFVIAAGKHEESFAALCRRFGVSRRSIIRGPRCIIRMRLKMTSPKPVLRYDIDIRPGDR
jgi:hypothetical protein